MKMGWLGTQLGLLKRLGEPTYTAMQTGAIQSDTATGG